MDEPLGVRDVFFQHFLIERFRDIFIVVRTITEAGGDAVFVVKIFRVRFDVTVHHKLCQAPVCDGIDDIFYDAQHVKSRQYRVRKFHIIAKGSRRIVSSADWVRRGNYRTSRL